MVVSHRAKFQQFSGQNYLFPGLFYDRPASRNTMYRVAAELD